MRLRGRGARLILSALAVLLALGGAAAAQTQAAPNGQKKQARQDNWPKKVKVGELTVSLDAPLAESLEGTKLKARGTARVQSGEVGEPAFATVWYEADVVIDHDRRTVTLASVQVPRVELAGAPAAQQQRIATRLSQALSRLAPKLSLDEVLASTKAARGHEQALKLNTDPPKILFETEPAILVVFDGEPRFRAVEGSKLERALNTPFLVLRAPGKTICYLSGGTTWFRAPDPKGPWGKADNVPPEAVQIALRDLKEGGVSESEARQAGESADKRVPKILVATEPTELIVFDGAPRFGPLAPGELETVSNSESDVFRTLPDQQLWVVLSGRWYRSSAFAGPWAWVEPDKLPASFRKIPSDSPRADALAFVPGTGPAREAVADASKPRTSAIRRKDAHVNVTYDGDPKFEPVSGTHVEYALNTPDQVLRIRGRYFVCDQGVWFSAAAPTGPWTVADAIPEDEIQAIPPESPVYNTRYAYVYDSTPDLVYMAYTPAYLGSYPYYGTVVFGTGWAYRPWWGAYYYPRPWTWGFSARYAPFVGWGYGFSWGPGWGGFRYGFGFGWGARWCGPGGYFRPAYRNVNITRNVNVTRNVYNSGTNRTRASSTTRTAAGTTSGQKQVGSKTTAHSSSSSAHGSAEKAPAKGKAASPHPAHAGGAAKKGGPKRG